MLIVSPSTATALAPHTAERSFVMFVQSGPGSGPVLIEAIKGLELGRRLGVLARDNAHETMLIGLLETHTPEDHARQIASHVEGDHIHHQWYAASGNLLAFIQTSAQQVLQELLAVTHPAAISDRLVDVVEMAAMLGVSVPTVRRMVKAKEIPCVRASDRVLRFNPQDVIASLRGR